MASETETGAKVVVAHFLEALAGAFREVAVGQAAMEDPKVEMEEEVVMVRRVILAGVRGMEGMQQAAMATAETAEAAVRVATMALDTELPMADKEGMAAMALDTAKEATGVPEDPALMGP